MFKRLLTAAAIAATAFIGGSSAQAAPVLCDSMNGWDACVDYSSSIHHVYIKDTNTGRDANLFITCVPDGAGGTRWMLHSSSHGQLTQAEAREFTKGYCSKVLNTFAN